MGFTRFERCSACGGFAALYPDEQIVQEVLAQITWYHNVTLLDKVKDPCWALWYAKESSKNGWSRNVLVHQIESKLYERQALALYRGYSKQN